jgi:phosphocarrier protein HPr
LERRKYTILNKQGIHTRSAATIVKHMSDFESSIKIRKDNHEVDGKSIMGILTLAARKGSEIVVEAHGRDSKLVLDKMQEIIENKFWEDDN